MRRIVGEGGVESVGGWPHTLTMGGPNDNLTPFGKAVKAAGAILLVIVVFPVALVADWAREVRQLWRSLTLKDPTAK